MIGLTNATIKSSTEPIPTTVLEKDITFYEYEVTDEIRDDLGEI